MLRRFGLTVGRNRLPCSSSLAIRSFSTRQAAASWSSSKRPVLSSSLSSTTATATASRLVRPMIVGNSYRSTTSSAYRSFSEKPNTAATADAPAAAPSADESFYSVAESASSATQQGDNIFGLRGFSWYPLAGLGTVVLISKELWVMDEYLIAASTFVGLTWIGWVSFRDAVSQWFQDEARKNKEVALLATDISIDAYKRHLTVASFSLSHGEELRNLYAEEEKIDAMAYEYQVMKRKLDTKTTMLSKLSTLKALEEDERRQAVDALTSAAVQYVKDQYAKQPVDIKSRSIDWGIDNIVERMEPGKKVNVPLRPDDPVRLIFHHFLQSKFKPEDLGLESQVKRYLEKEKKADAH